MGKPRMIIVIRHAQSEGNKDRSLHQSVPDHRVKLTPEGWKQAEEAGVKLRSMLSPDDTLHFFTSPYRRTRETTQGILSSLTSDEPSPTPFPRNTIKVYEEPRLREQDFGNFQPCSVEMERMWQERADYGHFFYRIPNGESAADAYDRVSGFNESLWRQFGEDDFASVCVLVTHGLMSRVFLMKWYHFSVEYFEDLRNVNHCEFVVMKKNEDNGKYILQNKLRTWSELKKERALAESPKTERAKEQSHIPLRRKWGGCVDGCNHGKSPDRNQGQQKQENQGRPVKATGVGRIVQDRLKAESKSSQGTDISSSERDEDDGRGQMTPLDLTLRITPESMTTSPHGTPPLISVTDREASELFSPDQLAMLHIEQDQSRSQLQIKPESSTSATSSEDDARRSDQRSSPRRNSSKRDRAIAIESGMGSGARADALGDQSDPEDDRGEEKTDRIELVGDRNVRDSVY
ncbi:MAG: hypothetical protein M4579_000315 [Chaenotheca gracillima]|nr:MAG: hypothetical protein M4579_000315 [Chaenotheca gracillima]